METENQSTNQPLEAMDHQRINKIVNYQTILVYRKTKTYGNWWIIG